jgi:hypothetical protein
MTHDPDPVRMSEERLWLVRRCGFDSLRELDAFLATSEPRARGIFEQLGELTLAEDEFQPWAEPGSVVSWLLLVLMRADTDVVALTAFRPSIKTAINTLIGNRADR